MMVLRRKVGEAIRIGEDIKVMIQEVHSGKMVRFGIEAPNDIAVHRLEVYEQIQAENRVAGSADVLAWLERGGMNAPGLSETFLFPQGVAGFPGVTCFGLIYESIGEMVCMHSMDSPETAFVLTAWDKRRLGEPPQLGEEQYRCLEVESPEELVWMLMLNPFADREWVMADLKAPIALSMSTHRGLQLILHEPQNNLRFRWMRQSAGRVKNNLAE